MHTVGRLKVESPVRLHNLREVLGGSVDPSSASSAAQFAIPPISCLCGVAWSRPNSHEIVIGLTCLYWSKCIPPCRFTMINTHSSQRVLAARVHCTYMPRSVCHLHSSAIVPISDVRAMTAVVLYDTVLTSSREIDNIWTRKPSLITWVYLLQRYSLIVRFSLFLWHPLSQTVRV